MKIYVVIGYVNDWDRYDRWLVAAYDDEGKAKDHAESANKWVKNNKTGVPEWRLKQTAEEIKEFYARRETVLRFIGTNPFDHRPMSLDDMMGSCYYVDSVELALS